MRPAVVQRKDFMKEFMPQNMNMRTERFPGLIVPVERSMRIAAGAVLGVRALFWSGKS